MSCEGSSSEQKGFERFCSIATCAILDEILEGCGRDPIKGKKQNKIDAVLSIQDFEIDDALEILSIKSLLSLIKRGKILGAPETRKRMTKILKEFFDHDIKIEDTDTEQNEFNELLKIATKEMKGNSRFDEFIEKHGLISNDISDDSCAHVFSKGNRNGERCNGKCSMIVIGDEIYKAPYCAHCMKNIKSHQMEVAELIGVPFETIANQVSKPKSAKSSDLSDADIRDLGKNELYPIAKNYKCQYIFTKGNAHGSKCGRDVMRFSIDLETIIVLPYCRTCLKKAKLKPLISCLKKIGMDIFNPESEYEIITEKSTSDEEYFDHVCPFDLVKGFWDRYFRLNISDFIDVSYFTKGFTTDCVETERGEFKKEIVDRRIIKKFSMTNSKFVSENKNLQRKYDEWVSNNTITETEIEEIFDKMIDETVNDNDPN